MSKIKIAGGALALVLTVGFAADASARSWVATHPRRDEVNSRLARQNYRIREGVLHGQISRGQARQLHTDDRAIRGEERADASVDGSHIGRGEQHQINQQENANSRAIYGERHPN